MGFKEDLAVADLAVVGRLGASISYTPSGGTTVSPEGVFDKAYQGVEAGNHSVVSSNHPAVFFRLADLPSDPEVDDPAVIFEGITYEVAEVHKDGIGGVLLILQKV